MKLLLDENLPKKLKTVLSEHEVFTVSDKKWNSYKNGELLKLMLEEKFNALLTFDKNLQYQQNFAKYPILVLVLAASDNTFETLQHLKNKINDAIKNNSGSGAVIINFD